MDSPPSTNSSPRAAARRALLTTVAALGALTVPVGAVAALSGDSTPVADVHSAANTSAVRFVDSATHDLDDEVRYVSRELDGLQGTASASVAPPTTTTTAAPTTTTTAPPPPPPAPKPGDPNDPATWDKLAQCEAGGNWSINTGNGYYGGLQFSASTWRSVGGTGLPHQNSREVQIEMGKRLQAKAGWGQWPGCTRKLGYR